MVPWPIAFLTLFYAVVATLSAATVWKIAAGVVARPLIWPVLWLGLSSGVMFGLPLLKPWGRGLAIVASVAMVLTTLAIAGLLVAAGRPLGALLTTVVAGGHVLVIRYLRRPTVRNYFRVRNSEFGMRSEGNN